MVEHVLKDFLLSGFDSAIFIIETTNNLTQCLPYPERKINLKGLIGLKCLPDVLKTHISSVNIECK